MKYQLQVKLINRIIEFFFVEVKVDMIKIKIDYDIYSIKHVRKKIHNITIIIFVT